MAAGSESDWDELREGKRMLMDNKFLASEELFAKHAATHKGTASGLYGSIMYLLISFIRTVASEGEKEFAVSLKVSKHVR